VAIAASSPTAESSAGAGAAPPDDGLARRRRIRHRAVVTLTNRDLAELLAREAEEATGHVARACRRASRSAFLWPVEAAALLAGGDALTTLRGIGPYLAERIRGWLETGAPVPEPPPLRHDFLTLTEARAILARAPAYGPLRGDLQLHTLWSDGTASIADMAAAARAQGHAWIAVTDHSQGLAIAHGLDESRLLAQEAEIERVNDGADPPCRVLRALEMNLAPDGRGDMAREALARLDVVLGAFHSALRRRDDQTERYRAAIQNPDVHILAHPRGRIYNFRLGLAADWPRVFAVAAALDKAVEIDAYPDRQDLNLERLHEAREAGVRISLGSDAHHPDQLAAIELGLAAAIAAGIPRDRILNFLTADELVGWVDGLRQNAAA